MTRLFLSIALVGLSLLVTGCQIPNRSEAPRFEPRANLKFSTVEAEKGNQQTLLQPSQELFRLGPGDQIQVEIFGRPTSRADLTVGPDGKIYFDLLPGTDVWGLTINETKRTLEAKLEQYHVGAQVSVNLRAVGSKFIWLLGALERPGIYPATAPVTLLEALSLAGGTQRSRSAVTTVDIADLRHAFVVREGKVLPVDFQRLLEKGDMSQNIYLQPEDFVYVPSGAAREIYLFGAVRQPRALPLSETPTLVAAITAGGGTVRDAFVSQVAIVRGSLTTPQIAVVDYKDILEGRAADIPLEPRDIVFVPFSPYRYLRNYADAILNTFVFTVAANEGANLFGGDNAGVSIGVGN